MKVGGCLRVEMAVFLLFDTDNNRQFLKKR